VTALLGYLKSNYILCYFKVFYTQNLFSLDTASATEYDVTREPAFYTPETKLLSAVSNPFKFQM